MGFGATSVVYKATDSFQKNTSFIQNVSGNEVNDSEYVAIKKIKNIFQTDFVGHKLLREIKLLRLLKGHKNVSNKRYSLI